jgi:selenocysteine lyase/cysteine desulfurase
MEQVLEQQRQGPFWQSRELAQLDHKVRTLLAQVVGCQPSDVSLFPDRASALLAFLAGLDHRQGEKALLAGESAQQLEGVAWFLRSLGYEVQVVAPVHWSKGEEFHATAGQGFALALVPWVDEGGWVADVPGLRELLSPSGGILVLDATQGVLCRPETFFELAELGVATGLVPGHTWLLGPTGVAALLTTEEVRQRWHWVLPSPRRGVAPFPLDGSSFDSPDLSLPTLAGMAASLELLLRQGLGNVRNRIWAHQRTLTRFLLELGWEVGSPGAAHSVAGIVLGKHPFFPAAEVQKRLGERHVRVGVLRDWVRFSPHFYTTIAEVEALRQLLARL